MGEGYTTPHYYTAKCTGSEVASSPGEYTYSEGLVMQFFYDDQCTMPRASNTTYKQRTCLSIPDEPQSSEVWFCEEGVATCYLCASSHTTLSFVVLVVLGVFTLALWR